MSNSNLSFNLSSIQTVATTTAMLALKGKNIGDLVQVTFSGNGNAVYRYNGGVMDSITGWDLIGDIVISVAQTIRSTAEATDSTFAFPTPVGSKWGIDISFSIVCDTGADSWVVQIGDLNTYAIGTWGAASKLSVDQLIAGITSGTFASHPGDTTVTLISTSGIFTSTVANFVFNWGAVTGGLDNVYLENILIRARRIS